MTAVPNKDIHVYVLYKIYTSAVDEFSVNSHSAINTQADNCCNEKAESDMTAINTSQNNVMCNMITYFSKFWIK